MKLILSISELTVKTFLLQTKSLIDSDEFYGEVFSI